MSEFEDLKLEADLIEHLGGLGYHRPTALQTEAVPVIARGTTVHGIASAGSGKTLAYGLGLAGRIEAGSTGLQALVLRPTDDGAAGAADELNRLLGPRGLKVEVVRPDSQTAAQVAVASPASAIAAVEHSAIKLDGLKTLVVDGASAMIELGAADALETLTAQVPRDAQRVVLTSQLTRDVEDYTDRHARRARQLTYLPAEVAPLSDAGAEYLAAPRHAWLSGLVALLGARAPRGNARLLCRRASDAPERRDQLAVRGIAVAGGASQEGVRVESEPANAVEPGAISIMWGTPADLAGFQARVAGAGRAVVFLEPRELSHLQRLASVLSVGLSALASSIPAEAQRSAETTRQRLRDAAANRDLEPYILLLEPLLEEFTPTQVAAAATALVREEQPKPYDESLPAWTRLYFAIGRRDNVRPADLVGAITGETPVKGDQIGRIEIRDTHCAVEVAASVADQVIKGLATTTIRGRPANVRVFRE
jgi:ATP-dependent RNA helicase DeaD